jgi:hypothetical protein
VTPLTFTLWAKSLRWLDGRPLLDVVEPYRLRLFEAFFGVGADGAPVYNLLVSGRAKKNWKSADLVLAAMFCLTSEPAAGYDADISLLANDADQAGDDLGLAKKLVAANAYLSDWLTVKRAVIERKDGRGFLEILPAGDVVGSHGKSRRFVGYDEIHGYRTWDVLEALAPDPHRRDAQQWITSYASLFHRPGAPLFDLCRTGRAGSDPRMLFSWYAADYTTDPDYASATPEQRANPSMAGWTSAGYLEQQRRRLPAHKFRRLHLNLPGLPEGSAYQPEPVMDAIDRGVAVRAPEPGVVYAAFVDMSGGSSDDAVLGIGHRDAEQRLVLDVLVDQGAAPPFDPSRAVERFARVLQRYRVSRVTGDKYAGETFVAQFAALGIAYQVAAQTKSQLYEAFEPVLNGHQAVLLDAPRLEQQLLGLVWRGGKIDHLGGEHDDAANAAVGVLVCLAAGVVCPFCADPDCEYPVPPFGLVTSDRCVAWYARHHVEDDQDREQAAERRHRAEDRALKMMPQIQQLWRCSCEKVDADDETGYDDIRRQIAEFIAVAPASEQEWMIDEVRAWDRKLKEALGVHDD